METPCILANLLGRLQRLAAAPRYWTLLLAAPVLLLLLAGLAFILAYRKRG
jgi:hypothetical protein